VRLVVDLLVSWFVEWLVDGMLVGRGLDGPLGEELFDWAVIDSAGGLLGGGLTATLGRLPLGLLLGGQECQLLLGEVMHSFLLQFRRS
jgi:hypothetical protein